MAASPHLLFVPGGGREGVGESIRASVLAEAALERWPGARIGFLTGDRHVGLADEAFERHVVPGRVSRNVAAVNVLLRELAPDVVVFDCRGRGSQIGCAARTGARTVYVAVQPHILRRALRLGRLRWLDQIWIVHRPVDAALTRSQRLRLRLARGTEVVFLDTVFPPPDAARLEALRLELPLGDGPYVLFAPGGGGYTCGGRPAAEIFAEAAQRLHRAIGITCVAVMGPLYPHPPPRLDGVTVIDSLPPKAMIDLVSGTHLLVCGGGGLVSQGLANARVCVAAPAGSSDQPERIRALADEGLIEPAPLDAKAIAARAAALLEDEACQEAIRARIARRRLCNGLDAAVDQLARLLERRPGAPP